MRPLLASLFFLATACGASAAPPSDPSRSTACESARADAEAAWSAVAGNAEALARPEGGEPLAAERALERVAAHVAALESAPRELDGDEALALSGAVMDAIDAVELPGSLRDRADDAAEALLTDRSDQGALRAGRDAEAVLEQVVQALRPGALEGRALREALSSLARRARAAAEGYAAGELEQADARADRAEGAALSDAAPAEVRDARAHATDASRALREACGIARRLTVPTL